MKTKFTILKIYGDRFAAFKFGNLKGISSELSLKSQDYWQRVPKNSKTRQSLKNTVFTLSCILFLLSIGLISNAQQVVQVNDAVKQLLSSSDPALKEQGVQLNQLVDDANPNLMANPTLYINENGSNLADGSVPIVVTVKKNFISQLYSENTDFENIQMIRIMIEDNSDLDLVVNLGSLGHFPNLKYVYFLTLFEVCPNNPGNEVCHASIFNNMISGSKEASNIQVVYKVSFVQ